MIVIHDEYRELFEGFTMEDFFSIEGEVFKEIQNRRTVRFERGGQAFFIKAHRGVGWREVFKNLLFLRLPVLGAKNEWQAIEKIHAAGLSTMQAVGYGELGINPAGRHSFLLTLALEDTVNLEQWSKTLAQITDRAVRVRCKRLVLQRVAEITRILHTSGINHRDFYLCHLRLDLSAGDPCDRVDTVPIHIMDLHRAQIRNRTPLRWAAKDIAGLMFSAIDGPAGLSLSTSDLARFVKTYTGQPLRQAVTGNRPLWRAVVRRYCRDYQRQYQRKPMLGPFLGNVSDSPTHG